MTNKIKTSYAFDVSEVFDVLHTSEQGLSEQKVVQSRAEYGENRLPLAPLKPAWKRFIYQIHNVLIYVLLGSTVISILLQHYVDSGVIFAVVLVNAIVGFIQEGKAEDALRAIISMAKTHSMVIRGGVLESIDSVELVPGDIVMLKAGDRVPAVEVLRAVDVICSDKTGTLTSNAMTAREMLTSQGYYRINAEGYKPEGAIELRETPQKVLIDHDSCFTQVCTVAMLCNDANLSNEHNVWVLHGDPTEGALLTLAMKHGLTLQRNLITKKRAV